MPTSQQDLREIQARLYQRQAWWEAGRSLAMILLAVAALAATSHLVDWLSPPRSQTITVHFDGPLFAPARP
jgi:hypothetical protein